MIHHRAIKDWIVGLLPGTTPHVSHPAGDSNSGQCREHRAIWPGQSRFTWRRNTVTSFPEHNYVRVLGLCVARE